MFLPLRVGRRPRRLPHAGRAARARGRRRRAADRRGRTRARAGSRTRANALLAAGLVTTSGSVLWVTGPVNADGPSLALSVLAVAFALRYRDDPRLRNAVWVGLAAGGAVSIKALSVPAVVIAGLIVLLSHRPIRRGVRDAAVAAGIALAVYVVAALPFGIGRVWDQSYTYHQDARRVNTPHRGRPQGPRHAVGPRPARGARARPRRRSRSSCATSCGAGPGTPGDRAAHASSSRRSCCGSCSCSRCSCGSRRCGAPTSRTSCRRSRCSRRCGRAPWSVLAVAAGRRRPFFVSNNTSILWPDGYTGHEAALVKHLERFPSDAQFISDDPGLVWRSGHDTPGDFADTSYQRIDDGQHHRRVVGRRRAAPTTCAA